MVLEQVVTDRTVADNPWEGHRIEQAIARRDDKVVPYVEPHHHQIRTVGLELSLHPAQIVNGRVTIGCHIDHSNETVR